MEIQDDRRLIENLLEEEWMEEELYRYKSLISWYNFLSSQYVYFHDELICKTMH